MIYLPIKLQLSNLVTMNVVLENIHFELKFRKRGFFKSGKTKIDIIKFIFKKIKTE